MDRLAMRNHYYGLGGPSLSLWKEFLPLSVLFNQYLGHVEALKVVFTFQLSDSNNTLFSTTLDTNLVSYLLNQF